MQKYIDWLTSIVKSRKASRDIALKFVKSLDENSDPEMIHSASEGLFQANIDYHSSVRVLNLVTHFREDRLNGIISLNSIRNSKHIRSGDVEKAIHTLATADQ